MNTLRQSVCLPMLPAAERDDPDLCQRLADLGFAGIELWGRDEQTAAIIERAAAAGLQTVSFCGHSPPDDGLNDPNRHPAIAEELQASIDFADQYDVSGVICFSGNRREGVTDLEALEMTVEGLVAIAAYAEERAVTLNLELLNSKYDHPGYNCDHTAWGAEVVRQVGSPHVKLLYDVYHMQIMEGDVIAAIREYAPLIGHFHTAGVPGRGPLNDDQELNYRGISQAIAASGYDLFIGHEFHVSDLDDLKQAFEHCNVQ